MHNSQQSGSRRSGAKGFALLVGIMVGIVLVIMAIAVILSPR
jgi:Tfp pilus assembly protein PilX